MRLLNRNELTEHLESEDDNTLFINPLLDKGQIGNVTVDLRLGYDFLVSILTRKPSIDTGALCDDEHRAISSYFQETRRELGDRFVVYPHQLVLATTLEYLALPNDVMADILPRSSYSRLAIPVWTMLQPGFRGCVPIELVNHGNTPVELVVGCRVCQARFLNLSDEHNYLSESPSRKYFGNVRPVVSAADRDSEIEILRSTTL